MNNRTEGEVVSEIKFLSGRDVRRSFLIVEGSDDSKFWRLRVNEHCVIVIASCKSVGVRAVRKLNGRGHIGHVGVFDRDYDDATTPSTYRQNIIFWDGHSLEAILYFSDAAQRVIAKKIDPADLATCERALGKSLHVHIAEVCVKVGEMRYLHATSGVQVDASALAPHRFIQRNTNLTFDTAALYAK